MRCVACDSVITSGARKTPVTTWSGEMFSIYTDSIKEGRKYLRKEAEDLCRSCLDVIRGYNSDMNNNPEIETDNHWFPPTPSDFESAYEDGSVSAEFDITDDVYEGHRDRGL